MCVCVCTFIRILDSRDVCHQLIRMNRVSRLGAQTKTSENLTTALSKIEKESVSRKFVCLPITYVHLMNVMS